MNKILSCLVLSFDTIMELSLSFRISFLFKLSLRCVEARKMNNKAWNVFTKIVVCKYFLREDEEYNSANTTDCLNRSD